MNKKLITTTFFFIVITLIFSTLLVFSGGNVHADTSGACGILPCTIYNNGPFQNIQDSTNVVASFIRVGLVLIFAGLIIFGLFLIVTAALTIIRSEGDESKVEEGAKAIKGVFIGIGIILVGLFGIVILLAIFQASNETNTQINAPANVQIPLITN